MASYTFYGVTADGYIQSRNASWATCQVGSGLNAVTADSADLIGHFNNSGYGVNQAFFDFDTSAIDDASEVLDATFSLYVSNTYSLSGGSPSWEARAYDWGASLTTADWRSAAQWNALDVLATRAFSGMTGGSYHAFTSYGVNLANWINKAGNTRFMVCTDNWTGIAPSSLCYAVASFADEAGTTKDPKLEVTTFEPPAFTPQVMWIA